MNTSASDNISAHQQHARNVNLNSYDSEDVDEDIAFLLDSSSHHEKRFLVENKRKLSNNPDYERRHFTISNIYRIMKKAIPESSKIAKETKELMQECISEFITFVVGEANERVKESKRKTIHGEDIIVAMSTLGFVNYVELLSIYLKNYHEKQHSFIDEGDSSNIYGYPIQLHSSLASLSENDQSKHPTEDFRAPIETSITSITVPPNNQLWSLNTTVSRVQFPDYPSLIPQISESVETSEITSNPAHSTSQTGLL